MGEKLSRREFLEVLPLLLSSSFLPANYRLISGKNSATNQPNIILILFDTLSASDLSLYGFSRNTTPKLNRFAERATVYHRHYSAGNFTSPGVASLLTGNYPWTHRAFSIGSTTVKKMVGKDIFSQLDTSYSRYAFTQNHLADLFLDQFSQAIDLKLKVGSFANFNYSFHGNSFLKNDQVVFKSLDELLYFNQGLSGSFYLGYFVNKWINSVVERDSRQYRDSYPRGIPNHPGFNDYFLLENAIDGSINFLQSLSSPFMVYLHFFPPHESFSLEKPYSPGNCYRPHKDFIGIFNEQIATVRKPEHYFSSHIPYETLNQLRLEYDEYIANTDAEFGRLLDYLEKAGYLDNSYVIVTSDHGQLFERGVHMHNTPLLYDPVVRVPLLISAPGQTSRSDITTPTSSVDLLPTIVRISGREMQPDCEGTILPGFGDGSFASRNIFAVEAKTNSKFAPLTTASYMMVKDRYKLIHYSGYPGSYQQFELYDLENDPEELEDISKDKLDIAKDLRAELLGKIDEVNSPFS